MAERERLDELSEFSAELRRALGAVRVVSHDCGSTRGVILRDPADPEVLAPPLHERALGRVLADDVVTHAGEVLARAGEVIGPRHHAVWDRVDEVSIRSLATCGESDGVCARCYGLDPDEGTIMQPVEPDDGREWTIPIDAGHWLQTPLGSVVERGDEIAVGGWVHARFGDADCTLHEVRDHLDLARGDVSTPSPCDGVVLRLDTGRVVVRSFAGREYSLRGRRPTFAVRAGDLVVRGEPLTYGATSQRRLLRIVGEEAVAALITETIEHHAVWGKVPFARVHAELLARAMLSWRRVRRPGDTGLTRNAVVSRAKCDRVQRETIARGGQPAEVVPIIKGLGRLAGRRWMLTHRERMARRDDE